MPMGTTKTSCMHTTALTTQSLPLLDGVSLYELSCPGNAFALRQDRAESGKMKPHMT